MDSLGSWAIGAVNIVGQCRWYIYIYATFILCLQIWNHSGSIPPTLVPVGSRLLSNGCSSLTVILNFQPITVPITSQIPLAASGRFDWSTCLLKQVSREQSIILLVSSLSLGNGYYLMNMQNVSHSEYLQFQLASFLIYRRFPNYPQLMVRFGYVRYFLLEVLFNMAVHSRYLSGPFSKRRSRSPFGRGCSTMGWKSEYGRLRSQVCMNPGCYLWYVCIYIYII